MIYLIIAAIFIAYIDLIPIFKKGDKRETAKVLTLYTICMAVGVLAVLKINLKSPLAIISEFMMEWGISYPS